MLQFKELGLLYRKQQSASPKSGLNLIQQQQQQQQSLKRPYCVGQERDGIFLVARDDLLPNKTTIECLELKTDPSSPTGYSILRTLLYTHETTLKICCASLNYERTILAYTTLTKNNFYETYLIELDRTVNNRFAFNVRGPHFQNIQFIPPQQQDSGTHFFSAQNSGKQTCHFLFFRDREGIEQYTVVTERKNGVTEIVSQPELHATFVQQYIWSQWDTQHSLLYYLKSKEEDISPSSSNRFDVSNSSLIREQCILVCCNFSDVKKPSFAYDYNLTITLPSNMSSRTTFRNALPSDMAAYYERHPSCRNGNSAPCSALTFSIEKLPNNATCFCQQIHSWIGTPSFSQQQTEMAQIFIFLLHHRKQFQWTFKFSNVTGKFTKVIFHALKQDLLLIYIPGIVCQVLDCGVEHEPWLLFQFVTNQLVPQFPHFKSSSQPEVAISTTIQQQNRVVLHLKRGILYEMNLNLDQLCKWALQQQNSFQEEICNNVIHLLQIHYQSTEKTKHFLKQCLLQQHFFVHCNWTELFKEFCMSQLYMDCKTKQPNDTLFGFISKYIPLSSKEKGMYQYLNCNFDKKVFGDFCIYSKLHGNINNGREACASSLIDKLHCHVLFIQHNANYMFIPTTTTTASTNSSNNNSPVSASNSPLSSTNNSKGNSTVATPSSAQSFSLKRFQSFFKLFHSKREDSFSEDTNSASVTNEDASVQQQLQQPLDAQRKIYQEVILDILNGFASATNSINNSKEANVLKKQLIKWSQEMTQFMFSICHTLFQEVLLECKESNYFFILLEHYYSCMEQLQFPCPTAFLEIFTQQGYLQLPIHLFLQYVHKGIFIMTTKSWSFILEHSNKLTIEQLLYLLKQSHPIQSLQSVWNEMEQLSCKFSSLQYFLMDWYFGILSTKLVLQQDSTLLLSQLYSKVMESKQNTIEQWIETNNNHFQQQWMELVTKISYEPMLFLCLSIVALQQQPMQLTQSVKSSRNSLDSISSTNSQNNTPTSATLTATTTTTTSSGGMELSKMTNLMFQDVNVNDNQWDYIQYILKHICEHWQGIALVSEQK